jgi:hypothetical protein
LINRVAIKVIDHFRIAWKPWRGKIEVLAPGGIGPGLVTFVGARHQCQQSDKE